MFNSKRLFGSVLMLGLLGLAACQDGSVDSAVGPALFDLVDEPSNASLVEEGSKVCKYGSDATFEVTRLFLPPSSQAGQSQTIYVDVADGTCKKIAVHDNRDPFDLTVTEMVPGGFVLDSIVVRTIFDPTRVTLLGTNTVTRQVPTRYAFDFYNSPETFLPGRMTGGGGQIRVDEVRITRGLTLHCDILLSNNLEINWTGGNKWHLDKPITYAKCIDDPNVDPVPPAAPFDTFIGKAVGRLNGVDGSHVEFIFVDDGEPGTTDKATIMIWAPGDDPNTDTPVLEVSDFLTHGNLQAHEDQPHR